jgi:hypothetical protein
MQRFVQSNQATLIVGIQGRNEELSSFLAQQHIPYLELANPHRYKSHGNHWTPKGHEVVADRIYKFLDERNYLSSGPNASFPLGVPAQDVGRALPFDESDRVRSSRAR